MENVLFSGESQLTNKTKRSKYYTIMSYYGLSQGYLTQPWKWVTICTVVV